MLDDGYQDQANEKRGNHCPAGPLRAGKYGLFEGGTRVPFIVRWPERVRPGVSDALMSQVDLAATLGALVGQPADPVAMRDSQNHLPALLGDSPQGRREVVEHAGRIALRQGKWKYITPGQTRDLLGPWQNVAIPAPGWLFDLEADAAEQNDLSATQPEKLKELRERLTSIRDAAAPAPSTLPPAP